LTHPTTISAPLPHGHRRTRVRVPGFSGWLIALASFVAVAPTLGWLEFSNGIEQLHAATVLEMRRDGGSWLMPTLNGTLRIKKPPLPAWIGALAVSDATVAGVAADDPGVRHRAFARLAWEIRWPVLLIGCLAIAAAFDMARTLAGRRVAFWAAVILATSLLFLRFTRLASTDVHLMLWVTVANAMLARVLLRRQRWALAVAGLAIGLAFMCKGPVGILQTLVPAAAAALLTRRRTARPAGRPIMMPALLALLAFLAVALPWPILVWLSDERALEIWWREITREGATDHEYGPLWSYLSLLPNLIPWLPAFLFGCALTFRRRSAPAGLRPILRHRGYLLAACWLLLPVIVMSLFRDKSERYLLPMLQMAALLAARGLVAAFAGVRRRRADAGFFLAIHLVIVAAMALALPVAGGIRADALPQWLPQSLQTVWPGRVDKLAWFPSLVTGVAVVIAIIAVVAMLLLLRRGRAAGALLLAAVLMLAVNGLMLWGYRDAPSGRSEMRPIAERIRGYAPAAVVAYHDPGGKPMPPDLSIYLNRVVRPLPAIRRRGDPEPDVIVMLQREQEPPPMLPGWRSFASEPYGRRHWHALKPAP